MRIGYSFWGFVGAGVTDTPDGGRSHRRTLLEGFVRRGHELVFLQKNRDYEECGETLDCARWTWADRSFPELDLLFLEWRWPIRGRSFGLEPTDPRYTPDWDRQSELVAHYTGTSVPTFVWDKDLRLPPDDPIRRRSNVWVFEAALWPRADATTLLFPVDDERLRRAQESVFPARVRHRTLVYIGNQYDRDAVFAEYFARPAEVLSHAVYGKWSDTAAWPHIRFEGRLPFSRVESIYRGSSATVLLLPDAYARVGQMTSRIFEATLHGCIPLGPATIRGISRFVPEALQVASGIDVVHACNRITMSSSAALDELWHCCLAKLDLFRASRQLDTIEAAATKAGLL